MARRAGLVQQALPGAEQLRAAVGHEIAYGRALWQGDAIAALAARREVLAEIQGSELRGYRAWWQYLAGAAAWLAARGGDPALGRVARGYFNSAAAAAPGVRWLLGLATSDAPSAEAPALSPGEARAFPLIERLER